MKKSIRYIVSLTMVAALLMPMAMAEELSLSATLEPSVIRAISAPFSGVVAECGARTGMKLAEGDSLLTMDTVGIYAPCDGTVAAIRVREGDRLSDVTQAYGAAMYVEPASPYLIAATTAGGYDANENRIIHVGERVYLTSVNNTDRKANGLITSVSGESYTVEVLDGNLRLNETCRVSRDSDSTESRGRIGQGKTMRNDPRPVSAEGSVLRVCVSEGDEVKQGDLLMEVAPGAAEGNVEASVTVPEDCVLTALTVSAGSAVQQGQTLATYFSAGTLHAVAQATEDDLDRMEIGGKVRVELDCDPEKYNYEGVIESISYALNEKGSYEVWISFENDGFVRQGMSATIR